MATALRGLSLLTKIDSIGAPNASKTNWGSFGATMSLISHLITRFAPSPENVAVEALGYILQGSDVASEAMTRLLKGTTAALPQTLKFRTQATSDDGARPDLEGTTESGEVMALIEAKFWAGLTEQQPVAYLKRFVAGRPGVLVFLVPAKRFSTIWDEVAGRCSAAGIPCGTVDNSIAEFWHAGLLNGHRLAIVSWRLVLDEITRSLTQSGRLREAGDLEQLRDLCDHMDDEAFMPFSAEELSSQIVPRRQKQLFALAAELGDAAIAAGIGGTRNRDGNSLTTPRTLGSVGRFMRLGGVVDVSVGYENARWAEFGISPFWVRFPEFDKMGQAMARERLSAWRHVIPQRYYEVDGEPCIPLRLPAGREKPQIIRYALDQLHEIKNHLTKTVSGAAE